MALRIFIQFRRLRILGESATDHLCVTGAACSKSSGRDFDFHNGFLRAQGEALKENA